MKIRIHEGRGDFKDFDVKPVQGLVIAGTGHRPDKLGGYTEATDMRLRTLACKVLLACGPVRVISGMALGWDMALAEACVMGKIPFDAYIPFNGQESRWQRREQDRYHELIRQARRVNVSWNLPSMEAFDRRNREMIRDGEVMLALWNGDTRGGTANAIRDSEAVRREVWNVWPEWEDLLLAPPSYPVAPR